MTRLILYLTASIIVSVSCGQDSAFTFDPVIIHAVRKPDTVIGSSRFYISDFEFHGEELVLLTFEKKPEKSRVMLADEKQKVIASSAETVNALKLYRDFLGSIYVVGKEMVWKVEIGENAIRLKQVDPVAFQAGIIPCIDTIDVSIAFSDYHPSVPEFSYYLWRRPDSTSKEFCHVIDEDLALMYSFEYVYLKPREKLYARKMERSTGVDKYRIAAMMTGFSQSHYFTPLYAPLHVSGDSMFLFEHYRNKLYTFNGYGTCIDSVPIDYHKPVKWREWKREVIRERGGERYFGLYQKDGYYFLKELDTGTGKIKGQYKLYYPYISNIKVRNGDAWYVYRPFESLQNAFLYKEPLPTQ